MKRLILVAALAASPALAQVPQENQLPSENACTAVLDRVQLALAQADRALQAENHDDAERWSGIAANYAQVYAAFCGETPAE